MMREILDIRNKYGLGAIKNEQIYPFLIASLILDGEESKSFKGFLAQVNSEFRDIAKNQAKEYVKNSFTLEN